MRRHIRILLTTIVALATIQVSPADAATSCTLTPRAGDPARPYVAAITATQDGVAVRLTADGLALARSYYSAGAVANWIARLHAWTPASCRSGHTFWAVVNRMASEVWVHAKYLGDPDISIVVDANWQNVLLWDPDQWRRSWWRVVPR